MKRSNKPLPEIEIINYGLYEKWDRSAKALPEFLELTTEIKAELDVEFGMIVEIRKAKGRYFDFVIDHPPFKDKEGNIEPPFEGNFRVKQNPYRFFLGDTIWEPIEDKLGDWILSILVEDQILVSKTLTIVPD